MKRMIVLVLVFGLFCSTGIGYAEAIHFDLSRVEIGEGELFINLENGSGSICTPTKYVWPESIPIPLIPQMPTPNIIGLGDKYNSINGYLTTIDGVTYWAGRSGEKYMPLPAIPMPLGTEKISENISSDWMPDIFPFNAFNKSFAYENVHSRADRPVFQASVIGKWIFDYDTVSKQCIIFVNGTYRLKTDIPYVVYNFVVPGGYSYTNVLYWEDDTTFYIKNYNLLLSTPKQPLYAALNALEKLPVIKLNNTLLGFEQPPVVEQDRTLVPMRFLFEQLGAQVSWDNDTRTATATRGDKVVSFSIDNTSANVNNSMKTMDVPARLVNDKTMIPLRFLSEELGYKVEWDEKTKVATIKEDASK